MINSQREAFIRGKIVAICQGIVNEEIGIIAGSRTLSSLGSELFGELDSDFITFEAIVSETGHLPVDWERRNWSDDALARKDKEIIEAETFHKEDALAACRKLIDRFERMEGI